GLVFGNLGVRADDKRQRFLNLAEGRGDLHQAAELDRLAEIARGGDQIREDDRELIIAIGEPTKPFPASDNPPPIHDDTGKTRLKRVELPGLATVKGDILCVFAQPDHAKAEIRFVALLVEIEPDQRLSDPSREHSTDDSVDQRRKDHIPWNGN